MTTLYHHLASLAAVYFSSLTTIHIVRSLIFDYLTLSLLEYTAHRWFMHRPRFAQIFGSPYLHATWAEHMDHHGKCYNIFDHEEAPCGLLNLTIRFSTELLVSFVPALLWFFVDPLTAMLMPVFALVHGILWSAVHQEMHRPQKTWFSRTWIFQYLDRYHFLHHRHMNTNFNTLFLCWDWFLFTAAKANADDLKEIDDNTWQVRPKRVTAEALHRSQLARQARESRAA